MERLINAITDLFFTMIKFSLIGGGILLLAGEVRLATLKNLHKGSPRLSSFDFGCWMGKSFVFEIIRHPCRYQNVAKLRVAHDIDSNVRQSVTLK